MKNRILNNEVTLIGKVTSEIMTTNLGERSAIKLYLLVDDDEVCNKHNKIPVYFISNEIECVKRLIDKEIIIEGHIEYNLENYIIIDLFGIIE